LWFLKIGFDLVVRIDQIIIHGRDGIYVPGSRAGETVNMPFS
jgi:hypothetical protein